MTRRALLLAPLLPQLLHSVPLTPLECVLTDPAEGDLVEGTNGWRVEVDCVDIFVSYAKIDPATGRRFYKHCTLAQWRAAPDLADARVVRLGVRG